MSDSLAIYLHDHVAGARLALELLEEMREQYEGEPLGTLADELLVDINEDRAVVERLAQQFDNSKFDPVKDSIAWLGEKATRWKLHRDAGSGIGTLQMLEVLAIGIQGKVALWSALQQIADGDDRLGDVDLDRLMARAREQHERVEQQRLEATREALRTKTSTA